MLYSTDVGHSTWIFLWDCKCWITISK